MTNSYYYTGDIIMVGFPFVPKGFLSCNGDLVSIAQYSTLYSLIGYAYGGTGDHFALPDLRGRIPVGTAVDNPVGHAAGQENVSLREVNLPEHTHTIDRNMRLSIYATTELADLTYPEERSAMASLVSVDASPISLYSPIQTATNIKLKPPQVAADANIPVSYEGESQAIANMQPYLGVNFCICVDGAFPPRD